jgi:hypothetical protein
VLRRIFGPKRDEVTGECRKLHIEELHDLYYSPSIITIMKARRMIWAGHVARMGEKRNVSLSPHLNTERNPVLGNFVFSSYLQFHAMDKTRMIQ